MIALLHLSLVVINTVTACVDDTLLIPEDMLGDNSWRWDYLLDGQYNTYWTADNSGNENFYYYFSGEVEVSWIFVQRYGTSASYFRVYVDNSIIANEYFGSGSYDSITHRFSDVYADEIRFYFGYSSTVHISRLEVWGCYITTMPTTSPTTGGPTGVPSSFPSVSPTSPPVTLLPSKTPSVFPTKAPTVPPSTAISPYPSTVPSFSPTEAPSFKTIVPSASPTASPTKAVSTNLPSVAPTLSPTSEVSEAYIPPLPSTSPSFSPTVVPTVFDSNNGGFEITLGGIEFLVIGIFCLCGLILFLLLRLRIANKNRAVLNNTENKAWQVDNTLLGARGNSVQTNKYLNATERVIRADNTGNEEDIVIQTTSTLNIGGESPKPAYEEASHRHGDVRFALDKVSSGNDEVFNTKGGLEIGPQDSAL